ncbi:HAMP domain-containing sensor histidine kinase [Colwellia sp. PAMC 21821]|uniref:sensor histidine kinase n=1 Tax=Colwellia sp. PAMC 21821 TaxID=1816219 RepID=UPI0009BE0033|nr:HAMP domain-containing sensor histidine kinase [Colwellia sp. PAMC 21821]ARD44368.1 hypothetical protein A3Q33_08610 [Colwellia sp. PAMC 21821]
MVKFTSLSIFTRLYLIIAIAMVFSGTVSVLIIEKIHVQGAIDDYVKFTDKIYADLLKEKKIDHNTSLQKLNKDVHKVEGYLISWKITLNKDTPCHDCEYVAHSGDVEVHKNNENQWFAVYKLPDVAAWLVIFENNIFNFESDDDSEEKNFFSELTFHDIEDMTQLMIVFFTIAMAIYWPVRAIKRQIESLINIHHQFGAGNLQARANVKLTKPLNELANSFNMMASAINDTVNENQVFAQAVPHEMRTPLSRIQLAVGLLSQNNENKQQVALLDNIDTYIEDMSVLIDQVVSFSKLNTLKEFDEASLYQNIALGEFIKARIEAVECTQKLNVTCELNDTLHITTNPAYLRLLVDNLLKNACIHAKQNMIVSLDESNGHIELSVADDGDGIPEEFLETIFVPFYRLDVSRSRKTGGLGLGLAISKAACTRMDCKITVENIPTAGAKFTCRFS